MHTTAPPPPSLRGTGLTIGGFLAVVVGLSAVPGVPADLRPLRLETADARAALVARVFAKPKLTLAEHESSLEGAEHVAMPDLGPADNAVDDAVAAAEDKELFDESRAATDAVALAVVTNRGAPPAAEAEEAVPAVDREAVVARAAKGKFHARAKRLRAVHAQLAMPGAEITNPCVLPAEGQEGCEQTALDPLFATLDAIARGDDDARAEVVVLGNSLIASDHVTDIMREALQHTFADGGKGFLLPDRLVRGVGRRARTGAGSEGWVVHHFARDPPWADGVRFGFTGSVHEASDAGDYARFDLDGARTAHLFYQDTGKGVVLEVDGRAWLTVPPGQATGDAKDVIVKLPPLAQRLTLKASPGARIYGLALERDKRGVVVDTIGVPAASTKLYTGSVGRALLTAQLRARRPTLNVVMLGGNETRALSYGTLDDATFEARLTELITTMKSAAPDGACLVVTPIDAGKVTTGDDTLVTRDEIVRVIAVQKKVAAAEGCAVFDLFAAMGGKGSLQKMREQKLVSDDLVHPTARGGDVLGQLFADAVINAYVAAVPTSDRFAHRRPREVQDGPRYAGLSFPKLSREGPVTVGAPVEVAADEPPPLSRFFARLSALARHEQRRVAIGQFGASHTAGQTLTDRMRARLAERYGSLGRGFVATGTASKRLSPSGVARDVIGAFDIADGRDATKNGALGMAGTKTRLLPGARFRVAFCQGCPGADATTDEPGMIELSWLYTPDMGTADVLIDGERMATIVPTTRRKESDVQFLRLPVTRERATIDVIARPAPQPSSTAASRLSPVGPVHLLGVVSEMDRAGVVLDAVGLPGTTGMTPQRWRQDLYAEEIRGRRYDLIITAWGTNEAGIASLDEATYRHHFGATLTTLREAAPDADCLIVGASDRLDKKGQAFVPAPNHELVERVQTELAAERGCAFFSLRNAMGGPGSMRQWVKDGLGHPDHVHFTRDGYHKLADVLVDDLLRAHDHWQQAQAGRPAPDGQAEQSASPALTGQQEEVAGAVP